MYRCFNILNLRYTDEDNYNAGLLLHQKQRAIIDKGLASYLSLSGTIDGSKLQTDWFPQIEADVFISHSHKDENMAITLAGWLYKEFKIRSFVDSTIWGFSNDLLKTIDNEYCKNPGSNTYDYTKRNYSTSHVHMMLSTALAKMMNSTECLFFLNTPNSISASGVINNNQTNSPWLYQEIALSSMIAKPLSKHTNRRALLKAKGFSESQINEAQKRLEIYYTVPTSHLTNLDKDGLNKWHSEYYSDIPKADYALDKLYELY